MKKISEILKETRLNKGLNLDEIESVIKIKKEFLAAIEAGKYHSLPSETYAQGFVKNYAKYLGIPASTAVPLFRREYNAKHSIHVVPEFRKTQHKFSKRFFLSAKTLTGMIIVAIVGVYFFFQYSSFFFPPELQVISPKNGQTIDGNIVEISGKTDPYATVTVNESEVYVDIQGSFKKSEYMFSGDNKISIVAKNRYGKETRKEVTVKVE